MNGTITLYAVSALLAFIPALVWLITLFKKTKRKGLQSLVFLLGIFSVVPDILLQIFFNFFPQFDVVNFLSTVIENKGLNLIIAYVGVGIVEELVKQFIVRIIDRRYLLVQTINDSIQFSLISALGFSFFENILYIHNIWITNGISVELIVAYLFRSIFTTCAHLVFSGFFGYYYGLAKFSLNIREESRWIGKKQYFTNFLSRVFRMPKVHAFKEVMILKGLLIAISLHAAYDIFAVLNLTALSVLLVAFGYLLLKFLLKQKSGRLILITDLDQQRSSTMAKTDEEVVIELMGLWFQKGRYVDVIHICERLLKRDPDNKVVQLFKAQAIDKMDTKSVYTKILQTIFPHKGPDQNDIQPKV